MNNNNTHSLLLCKQFECCGWHNGSDYVTAGVKPLRWHTTTDDGAVLVVPWSCCPTHNETLRNHCVTEPTSSDIYVTSVSVNTHVRAHIHTDMHRHPPPTLSLSHTHMHTHTHTHTHRVSVLKQYYHSFPESTDRR